MNDESVLTVELLKKAKSYLEEYDNPTGIIYLGGRGYGTTTFSKLFGYATSKPKMREEIIYA